VIYGHNRDSTEFVWFGITIQYYIQIIGGEMMSNDVNREDNQTPRFRIVDLNYVSLYYDDFQAAIEF